MSNLKDNAMWRCPMPQGKTEREQQLELELEQAKVENLRQEIAKMNKEQDSWQQARIRAAIAAMQGMLANPAYQKAQVESGEPFGYFYAMNAIMCADILIAELKKRENNE